VAEAVLALGAGVWAAAATAVIRAGGGTLSRIVAQLVLGDCTGA